MTAPTSPAPAAATSAAEGGLVGDGVGRAHLQLVAELCLLAVHLSVVVGFARLYRGTGFAGPMAAFAVVPWVVSVGARRRHVPAPVVVVAAVVATILTPAIALFRHTLTGPLPTSRTWSAATAALHDARIEFPQVVAPTPARLGFQLVAGMALLGAMWFADWSAFRLRATAEAVAPAAVLFVFGSLLGAEQYRTPATIAFIGSVLAFVAVHRAWRSQADRPWLAATPGAGPWSMARGAVVVALLALTIGAVAGPRLPGAGDPAVLRWRHHGEGNSSRVTISPMVELRKRLVDQSDTELFTVESNQPAYWRLTSLDRFDGRIWSSSGEFAPAGDRLPRAATGLAAGRIITQQIQIEALSAIWVPVAFEARGVPRSSEPLRWDEDSSTLIVDSSQPSSDGLSYTATSVIPDLSPKTLSAARGPDDPAIVKRYEALPATFPRSVADQAERVTRLALNRYEQAKALQDWFRSAFTYSLAVPPGHGDDALVEFLDSRQGYCEQFAGAFAAMARSLGIPARVAVGFTPGEVDHNDPTEYHVRGRHAHAWPEVWFPKVGWVPFEPTPGRGIPDAQPYTGVAPAQDPTISRPQIVVQSSRPPVTDQTQPRRGTQPVGSTPASSPSAPARGAGTARRAAAKGHGALIGGIVALAVLLLGLGAAFAFPRVRRLRHRADHRDHPVLAAWDDALVPVRSSTGQRPSPAETHLEFARRVSTALGVVAVPFSTLADLATAAAWSPGPEAERATADDAVRLAAEVRTGLARASRHETPPRQESDGDGGSSSRRRRLRTRSDVSPK